MRFGCEDYDTGHLVLLELKMKKEEIVQSG
jgi:hypothetical protein